MKTKRFNFGIVWQMFGTTSIEVPEDFTIEQAVDHVEAMWPGIELPRGDYIPDSDAPDFADCHFSEGPAWTN